MNNTKTTHRILSLAAVTVLGLTLASCSGDTGGGDETSGGDGGATTEQADDTTTEGDDTADDETAEDEGDGAAAGGAECLIGAWSISPEAMEEQVVAQLGGEGEASVAGTTTMTFDGTTVTTNQSTTSSYSGEIEGIAVETETTTDGVIVVNYTADDAVLTYADVVSAEGTVSVTVGGATQEQDIADTASLMTGQTQSYTCTDSELTLTTDVTGFDVTVTLTRA